MLHSAVSLADRVPGSLLRSKRKANPTGGFDADRRGNPPFVGGRHARQRPPRRAILIELKTASRGSRTVMPIPWPTSSDAPSTATVERGCFALIVTKTIGQGDTRSTGAASGYDARVAATILCGERPLQKWPGLAAVVVSSRTTSVAMIYSGPFVLNGREETDTNYGLSCFMSGMRRRSQALVSSQNCSHRFCGFNVLGYWIHC